MLGLPDPAAAPDRRAAHPAPPRRPPCAHRRIGLARIRRRALGEPVAGGAVSGEGCLLRGGKHRSGRARRLPQRRWQARYLGLMASIARLPAPSVSAIVGSTWLPESRCHAFDCLAWSLTQLLLRALSGLNSSLGRMRASPQSRRPGSRSVLAEPRAVPRRNSGVAARLTPARWNRPRPGAPALASRARWLRRLPEVALSDNISPKVWSVMALS